MRARRMPGMAPGLSKDVAPGSRPETSRGEHGPGLSAGVVKPLARSRPLNMRAGLLTFKQELHYVADPPRMRTGVHSA
jgi:hypothetical protein